MTSLPPAYRDATERITVKKFFYAVAALLLLLVAAAVIAPFVIDLNDYKDVIAARAKALTGRDIAIEGDIDLTLLPAPTVAVNRVRVVNLPGAAAPDMLRLKSAEARIALMPLLRGEVKVESFTLVEPALELEALADGRVNWQFETGAGAAPEAATTPATAEPAVRLDHVAIENGTLVYRDSVSGRVERIGGLNMTAGADSLAGPFRAEGSLVARGAPLSFKLGIGALERRPTPINLEIALDSARASLIFAGSLSALDADAEVNGKLKFEGASLARFLALLGSTVGPSKAFLDHAFSASGVLSGGAASIGFNDVDFELNGVQGTGAVSAVLGETPRIDAALSFTRVDLDQLLASATTTAATAATSGTAPAPSSPFVLPGEIAASFDVRANAVIYNGAVVRQAQLTAALRDGTLTLQQVSALLPGGSDITVFGVLDSAGGAPRFSGQIEASADNLRAVLDWLRVPLPPIPADRLRKLSLSTKLEVTPELAKISALDLRLDLSRLTGGVNLAIGPRPAFNAILVLDRINLDAYLTRAVGTPADGAARGEGKAANPLAALAGFDGEIKARIGKLVYNTVPIDGLALDAGLVGGKLTLRGLAFEDLAGANGALNGTIDATRPALDLTFGIETADLNRLLRVFDVAPAESLGRFKAHGRVGGDLAALTLDTKVILDDVRASLAGTIAALATEPAIDLAIDLRGANLSRLARRLGARIDLAPGVDAAFSLKGKVKGDAGRTEVKLGLAAAGIEGRLDGLVIGLAEAPSYDVALTASHPDLARLATTFGAGGPAGGRDLGGVRIAARVTGDALQAHISDFDATLGPTRLAGDMTARWDGPRPRVDAELSAGDIVVDMFLAPATAGAGEAVSGADAPAEARWSRAPLDLSGLRALDAAARIKAKSLTVRQYRFDDVTLALKLADGVLDIDKLSGRLYGAPAELAGRIADSDMPSAEIALNLAGADLKPLLIDAAGVDAVSGRLDLTGRFHASGRSAFELISDLAGNATIAVRDGLVRGFDLGRLNRQLGELDSEAAFIELAGAALSGGETRIAALDGTVTAKDGVLRSDDLRLVADGGTGAATATVNLPGWNLVLDSSFRLTGHPDAPAVGITLRGPIDKPERTIDDRELKAYVARKVIGGVIRKAVPGAGGETGAAGAVGGLLNALTGGGAAQPAPVQPAPAPVPEPAPVQPAPAPASEPVQPAPAQQAPQKQFENLLKGLLKGVGN